MPVESSPAFQFYVKEWRSSRAVMRMTFGQRGMYLEMLLEQWENITLPDNPAEVAELIGGTDAEWQRHWPVLRRKFVTVEGGRMQNLRLEKERYKQKHRSQRASDRGKAGAAARWLRDGTSMPTPSQPDASSITGNGFPIPIAFPIATADTGADAFARFWANYPKKVGEKDARTLWTSMAPAAELAEDIIAGAIRYGKHVADWEPRYVKSPFNWLEGLHWNDQLPGQARAERKTEWSCPDDPPCPAGTTQFQCHQRAQLQAAKGQKSA